MTTLALLGFLAVGSFLGLVLFARMPVLLALIVVPLIAGLAGGFGNHLGAFAIEGLKTVAPVATMILFAVLYFGLMIDKGLFDPLVRRLVAAVRADPVRLCLVTAILPMMVALDGDGATTFLISVTALLPVHRQLGINPVVLPGIVGLSAGVMNLLPWGGPTARAIAVLGADVSSIFVPVIPAMLAGIVWVLFAAWWIGRGERRRLNFAPTPSGTNDEPAELPVTLPPLFWFNMVLTLVLIVLLFQDLYSSLVPVPPIPAPLLFMLAFVIALPVNCRSAQSQKDQFASHASEVVLVVSMILAAGVFAGILGQTGMIGAMAIVMAGAMPEAAMPWLSHIVALTGVPLSLVFTPDTYYFGIMPVFAGTAAELGQDPLTIGRAAILGQMTTGFPLSPLTASTFILIGLAGVSLRDHQRFLFKWAFGTTVVMTIVASITKAI